MKPKKSAKSKIKTSKTKIKADMTKHKNFAKQSIISALENSGWHIVDFSHPVPEEDIT